MAIVPDEAMTAVAVEVRREPGARAVTAAGSAIGAGVEATRAAPVEAGIVIEKLTRNVKEDHLREIFGTYGSIRELELPINRPFATNKGIAYVFYHASADAEAAIAHMHEGQLDGAIISVSIVLPRRKFSRSPPPVRRAAPASYDRYENHGPPPPPRSGYPDQGATARLHHRLMTTVIRPRMAVPRMAVPRLLTAATAGSLRQRGDTVVDPTRAAAEVETSTLIVRDRTLDRRPRGPPAAARGPLTRGRAHDRGGGDIRAVELEGVPEAEVGVGESEQEPEPGAAESTHRRGRNGDDEAPATAATAVAAAAAGAEAEDGGKDVNVGRSGIGGSVDADA
ncbi:MAG: hypothetical protein M1826_001277 [Phylliscum demangeonii]|nr:MAG: hypothetical protein M1826_001277 [Phylliscum demangeonii]